MAYVSAYELLPSLDFEALPDGAIAIDAAVLIKTLNEDGAVVWSIRFTDGFSPVEGIGAVRVIQRRLEQSFDGIWDDEDD